MLGQFANLLFGPAFRKPLLFHLLFHRLFLRLARRYAFKLFPARSYAVTTNPPLPSASGTKTILRYRPLDVCPMIEREFLPLR
ncbi:MAG TPA: hypothetical protein VHR72_01105, partial [Gemmataceae bacterium]|jgi:hypothetical protein|nr:hypothetical protein [Gemmataceae bacterium]